jgi:hypothetical protein
VAVLVATLEGTADMDRASSPSLLPCHKVGALISRKKRGASCSSQSSSVLFVWWSVLVWGSGCESSLLA